jgi:hypothetical protein
MDGIHHGFSSFFSASKKLVARSGIDVGNSPKANQHIPGRG